MLILFTQRAYRLILAIIMIIVLVICTSNSDIDNPVESTSSGTFSETAFTLSLPASFDDSTEAESPYVIAESLVGATGLHLRGIFRLFSLIILLCFIAWSIVLQTRSNEFFFKNASQNHQLIIRYIQSQVGL